MFFGKKIFYFCRDEFYWIMTQNLIKIVNFGFDSNGFWCKINVFESKTLYFNNSGKILKFLGLPISIYN